MSPDIAILTISSLFVMILALSTYSICKRINYEKIGVLAVFIVLTYPIVFFHSRLYMLDLPLTALVTLGFLLLFMSENFTIRKYSIAIGIIFAVGQLTKIYYLGYFLLPLIFIFFRTIKSSKLIKLDKTRRIINLAISIVIGVLFSIIFFLFRLKERTLQKFFSLNTNPSIGTWQIEAIIVSIRTQIPNIIVFFIFCFLLITLIKQIKNKKFSKGNRILIITTLVISTSVFMFLHFKTQEYLQLAYGERMVPFYWFFARFVDTQISFFYSALLIIGFILYIRLCDMKNKKIILIWLLGPFLYAAFFLYISSIRHTMPILPAAAIITASAVIAIKRKHYARILVILILTTGLSIFIINSVAIENEKTYSTFDSFRLIIHNERRLRSSTAVKFPWNHSDAIVNYVYNHSRAQSLDKPVSVLIVSNNDVFLNSQICNYYSLLNNYPITWNDVELTNANSLAKLKNYDYIIVELSDLDYTGFQTTTNYNQLLKSVRELLLEQYKDQFIHLKYFQLSKKTSVEILLPRK